MILKPRRDHTVLYMCAVMSGLGIRSFAQNCCFHCVFDSLSLFFQFFAIKSKSLLSLVAPLPFFKEQRERFAHGKERIVISLFRLQKTSKERTPNPE